MIKNKKKLIHAILLILLILIVLFAASTTTSHATDTDDWDIKFEEQEETAAPGDTIAGVLTYGAKTLALVVLGFIKQIMALIINAGGGNGAFDQLTPATIIFNDLPITNVSYFFRTNDTSIGYISDLQSSVSLWYTAIRNLSVIILLGILLYVGIRMAISTVASEEAKYKKMFKDWVQSLILVYVLQYIMIIVIEINNILVTTLGRVFDYNSGNGALSSVMGALYEQAWSPAFTQGVGCTILYGLLIMITFLFLIMYLKRMIITAFLIIISPLITITYSIDKMGDGKSQALNNWLKEFSYNILIQPFHCIIYGALVLTAVNAMASEKSIAALIMSIVTLIFMFKAEDLVKKIFGVQPSTLGGVIAGSALALSAMNMLKKKNKDTKQSQGKMANNKLPNWSGKDYGNAAGGVAAGAAVNAGTQGNGNGSSSNTTGGSNAGTTAGTGYTGSGATDHSKGRGWRKAARIVGKGAIAYAKGSAKVGAAAAGAILGAGTGDMKGAVAGAALGTSVAAGAKNKYNNLQYRMDTRTNEKVMASEYDAWAEQQGYDSEEEYIARTEAIMNADIDKGNLDAGDLKYRQYLDNLTEQYKGGGENDAAAKRHVLDTIKQAQMGDIKHSRYTSQGGYERTITPNTSGQQVNLSAQNSSNNNNSTTTSTQTVTPSTNSIDPNQTSQTSQTTN